MTASSGAHHLDDNNQTHVVGSRRDAMVAGAVRRQLGHRVIDDYNDLCVRLVSCHNHNTNIANDHYPKEAPLIPNECQEGSSALCNQVKSHDAGHY